MISRQPVHENFARNEMAVCQCLHNFLFVTDPCTKKLSCNLHKHKFGLMYLFVNSCQKTLYAVIDHHIRG